MLNTIYAGHQFFACSSNIRYYEIYEPWPKHVFVHKIVYLVMNVAHTYVVLSYVHSVVWGNFVVRGYHNGVYVGTAIVMSSLVCVLLTVNWLYIYVFVQLMQ